MDVHVHVTTHASERGAHVKLQESIAQTTAGVDHTRNLAKIRYRLYCRLIFKSYFVKAEC